MRTFVAAAIAGLAAAHSELEINFMNYITEHGKSYKSMEEYYFRLSQFARNNEIIETHNAMPSSFKLGHNKMSDWTEEEYKALLNYKPQLHNKLSKGHGPHHDRDHFRAQPYMDLEPIDWRAEGAVNPVQDQGHCGSCWAFSTTATLEGAHYISSRNLEKFAEQQLVDCVDLCFGCNGGNVSLALHYWEQHDAMYEQAYAYTAKGGHCEYVEGSKIRSNGNMPVEKKNTQAMKAAVAQAPLSVAIQANKAVFQSYKSGIFNDEACGGLNLDHATNVVGWGNDATYGDYWIMRNSWGTTWGEEGYMRMSIVDGMGICGVQKEPSFTTAN